MAKFVFDNADQVSPEVQLSVDRPLPSSHQYSSREVGDIYKSICCEWVSHSSDSSLQTKMGVYVGKSALKPLMLLLPMKECCNTPT